MTSREQFEDWFNDKSKWKIVASMRTKSGYINNPSAQSKWEVWQASRRAIEIELPSKWWDIAYDGSQHYDCEEISYALAGIGIRIKGE